MLSQYGEKYDPMLMHDSKRDVANLLHEESDTRSVREFIRRKQQQQARQKQNKKKSRDSWGAIIFQWGCILNDALPLFLW